MGLVMGNLSDSSRWSMHGREAKSVMMPTTASSTAESYSYSYTDAISGDPKGIFAEEAGKIAADRYAKILEKRRKRIVTAVGATLLGLSVLVLSTCGGKAVLVREEGREVCYVDGSFDGPAKVGTDGKPTCEDD